MVKSGLIAGALALVIAVIATYITPICTPCASLFIGLGAGYLADVFDKPSMNNSATRTGALGGAIGGVGASIGQLIGTVLNVMILGPQGALQLERLLGLQVEGGTTFTNGYWVGAIGGAVCFSIIDILLMAAFGALGGIIWWQTDGKNRMGGAISQGF